MYVLRRLLSITVALNFVSGCGTPDYLPPPRPSPTVVGTLRPEAEVKESGTAQSKSDSMPIVTATKSETPLRTSPTAAPTPGEQFPAAKGPGSNQTPTSESTVVRSEIVRVDSESKLTERECRQHTIDALTKIAQALEEYRRVNNKYPDPSILDVNQEPVLSWRVALLPLLGYDDLYQQFKLGQPWDSAHNRKLLQSIPREFRSPERGDERTNFLLVIGREAAFQRQYGPGPATNEFGEGLANTLLLAEFDDSAAVPWTKPADLELNMARPKTHLGTLRQTGFYGVFGQIGVRFIKSDISDADLAQSMLLRKDRDLSFADISSVATAVEATTSTAPSPSLPPAAKSLDVAETLTASVSITPAVVPSATSVSSTRLEPPSTSMMEPAESVVRKVYEPLYRRAKNREEQRAVATQMIRDADTVRQDASSYFVMLRLAREIATSLQDASTAREAARKLDDAFQLDPVKFKLPWLENAIKHSNSKESLQFIFEQAVESHREVLFHDQFDACSDFQKLALAAARKMDEPGKVQEAAALKTRTDRARTAYQAVGPALHQLLRFPHDEAANATVGRYLCLNKGDWSQGLIHLSKGNDEGLKAVAILELENPRSPELIIATGDAYWTLSETSSKEVDKRSLQERAAFWYRQAVDQLPQGLRKVLVRERLNQTELPRAER